MPLSTARPSHATPKRGTAPNILVTGASSGIGLATISQLAAKGARVFAGIRNSDHTTLVKDVGAQPVPLDLSDPESIRRVGEWLSEEVGSDGLLALVNNAGWALAGPLELLSRRDLEAQFSVNLFGLLELTTTLLPLMRIAAPGSRIVNISSVSGRLATPFAGAYAASKHSLEAITDALRQELRPWRIRVLRVVPGRVATPIWGKARSQLETLLAESQHSCTEAYREQLAPRIRRSSAELRTTPDMVADTIVRAIFSRSPRSTYFVGRDARIMCWLGRLPVPIRDMLLRRL